MQKFFIYYLVYSVKVRFCAGRDAVIILTQNWNSKLALITNDLLKFGISHLLAFKFW